MNSHCIYNTERKPRFLREKAFDYEDYVIMLKKVSTPALFFAWILLTDHEIVLHIEHADFSKGSDHAHDIFVRNVG